jgi:hypothetical protein
MRKCKLYLKRRGIRGPFLLHVLQAKSAFGSNIAQLKHRDPSDQRLAIWRSKMERLDQIATLLKGL